MGEDRSSRRIAVLQSNYIPWKGYFDLIGLVDEFVLYDEVQYTKNDWRNRNRIKSDHGLQWLTIPVLHHGRSGQRIDEARVADDHWRAKHWTALRQSYGRQPFFAQYRPLFEELYLASSERSLSAINRSFITAVCAAIGIGGRISASTDYEVGGDRNERLVGLCQAVGADVYLSGPSARSYLDESGFSAAGIAVEYMDYGGYPEYPQPYPPFDHAVTILDLLFCVGESAPQYMKFASQLARSSP